MTSDNDSIFNRLQLFGHQRRSSSSDEDHADSDHSEDPDRLSAIRQRVDPSTSSVKRCLFGRGNSEENIKFAKKEMEKSLAESKKRWNFDFEKERPMEGRFEWQSSPYPKVILKSRGATGEHQQENVEPTATTAKNTHSSIKLLHTSTSSSTTSSSSDERICDWDPDETSSSASASSKPELPGASSSQRSSSRQPKIDKIFRQKRSKSKVKTQERKTDQPRLEPVGVAAVATGGGAAGPPPASLDTTKPTTQQESD